jgi:rhodanese-related sulfurtransferase
MKFNESASQAGSHLPATLDVAMARAALEMSGASLIDVRGFAEFAAGHARGAKCIPLPDIERRCGELPTANSLLVICQSGGRSAMAVERLRALGFDNVHDVVGGTDAWVKAGLPVEGQPGVIPLERQVRGAAGALVFGFTAAGLLTSRWFLAVPLFVGFMLSLSCVTGVCPMLSILRRMPWNRPPDSRIHAK